MVNHFFSVFKTILCYVFIFALTELRILKDVFVGQLSLNTWYESLQVKTERKQLSFRAFVSSDHTEKIRKVNKRKCKAIAGWLRHTEI